MVHEARSGWRQSMAPGHEDIGVYVRRSRILGYTLNPTRVLAHECGFRCLGDGENRSGVGDLRKDEGRRRQFGRFCHRGGERKNSLVSRKFQLKSRVSSRRKFAKISIPFEDRDDDYSAPHRFPRCHLHKVLACVDLIFMY